jgi:DNA polymerase-4
MKMKTILLVDMDAFFASVEQQSNPALRGRPIGVIGASHRTVITTASYEARRYGVKTGMSKYEAKRLCPELILVVGDNNKYTHTCAELKNIYLGYTPQVEIYSVDEAFLDISGSHHLFGGPLKLGRMIKRDIKKQFGIDATVGIGPNRLIAKLAADTAKPDGLRWIRAEEVEAVLEDLPVDELWGIGKRMARRLESLGIRTCGELGRAPVGMLRSHFGIIGERLKAMGMGLDSTPVKSGEEKASTPRGRVRDIDLIKSIGHSMTLPRDLYTRAEREPYMLRLSEMVGSRARRYGFMGRRIRVMVRYRSFETFTRQRRLTSLTNDTHRIFHTAMDIMDSIKLREPVRLLGVVLGDLEEVNGQLPIFEDENKRSALLEAMDGINQRYGSFTLTWASCLLNPAHEGVISPAWRPSGIHRTL